MIGAAQTRQFPLAMASEGERVRIESILGGGAISRRVAEIGLNVGSEVFVRQRQGAGLIVARGETRIAIGGGMALKIMVSRS